MKPWVRSPALKRGDKKEKKEVGGEGKAGQEKREREKRKGRHGCGDSSLDKALAVTTVTTEVWISKHTKMPGGGGRPPMNQSPEG